MTLELIVEYKGCGFIMNRIVIQFQNMMQSFFYNIDDDKKGEINEKLDKLSIEFKHLYDHYQKYISELEEGISKIKIQIEETQKSPQGISFDNPTIELQRIFEEFMMKTAIITRKLVKILAKIYDVSYKEIEGKKFESFFKEKFGENSKEHIFSKVASKLLEEFYIVRGDIEHEDLDIQRMTLKGGILELPTFMVNGKRIKIERNELGKYMKKCFDELFGIAEDMIAIALNHIAPKEVHIYSLSEAEKKEGRFKDCKYGTIIIPPSSYTPPTPSPK